MECDICGKAEGFIFCHFRFWIMDSPIGDWAEESVLGVLAHSAGVISKYQGNRHLPQADNLSAIDLWEHVTKICDSDDPMDLHISLEGRYHQKFLLHELADDAVATVCEVIVIERSDGIQLLLWKNRGEQHVNEIDLPKLTVDNAISTFIDWAKQQA